MNSTSKTEIKRRVRDFVNTWQDSGDEVADKVTYWNTLLSILGVPQEKIDDHSFIKYEYKINTKQIKFHGAIDAYIPSTRVLIEQKSNGVSLTKPESRPNGGDKKPITPLQQAVRYNTYLPTEQKANYIVLCNFSQFMIYDIRQSLDNPPVKLDLKDLGKNLYLFRDLIKVDKTGRERLQKEKEVSLKAGELVSKMYNELLKIYQQYPNEDKQKVQRSINTLIVRLVFCLYAEDSGLFDKEQFYNYLKPIAPNRMGKALEQLFHVLDTEKDDRLKQDPFFATEEPELMAFPYVNGGLYKDEDVIVPPFTDELKDILLEQASRGFDWSPISPTIFGAVFESTLNPEERRQGGMHYTSVENIHKVIDPLFLDDLEHEMTQIEMMHDKAAAKKFQDKISSLTFLDPACGSGNFLTETYLSLRRLENRAILIIHPNPVLDTDKASDYIKVQLDQFYGFEINDFAVSVAKTALWIAESQMMEKTKDILYANWNFLPLKTYTHIHECNALRIDWNKTINDDPTKPNIKVNYIISNPPFAGARFQDKEQKADVMHIFNNKRGAGNIDYVACWYQLAAKYMIHTNCKTCFVSTNSITQGEQVSLIWENLFKNKDFHINFAYHTFKWSNEASKKAQVYVVIIGISYCKSKTCFIFDKAGRKHDVKQINPYLIDSKPLFLHDVNTPLSARKSIVFGSMPNDKGYLSKYSSEDVKTIVSKYPNAKPLFKQLIGSTEFINNKTRYCLWLYNIKPNEWRQIKPIKEAVESVKAVREKSKRKSTNKLASTPYLFGEIRQPQNGNYIAIPEVSSEKRKYIPMGFVSSNVVANNRLFLIPDATIYEFGILESIVHMAWTRTVTGRLKSDYNYSAKIVYNNFPWPNPTAAQKQKIANTAQAILDAREPYLHPKDGKKANSLADLYDPLTMPVNLLRAHKANDKAVMQAYGFDSKMTEPKIVAELFKMYEQLVKEAAAKVIKKEKHKKKSKQTK